MCICLSHVLWWPKGLNPHGYISFWKGKHCFNPPSSKCSLRCSWGSIPRWENVIQTKPCRSYYFFVLSYFQSSHLFQLASLKQIVFWELCILYPPFSHIHTIYFTFTLTGHSLCSIIYPFIYFLSYVTYSLHSTSSFLRYPSPLPALEKSLCSYMPKFHFITPVGSHSLSMIAFMKASAIFCLSRLGYIRLHTPISTKYAH